MSPVDNTIENNKALARRLINAVGKYDAEDCLAEDVIFETPGQFSFAGFKAKSELAKSFPAIREVIPDAVKFTIHTMTAEDDRVHAELPGEAKAFDGVEYKNRYHYALVIRDGKIVVFRDYMESDLAVGVIGGAFQRYGVKSYVPSDA